MEKLCKAGQATDDNMVWIIYLLQVLAAIFLHSVSVFTNISAGVPNMLFRVPSHCTSVVKSWQNNLTLTFMRSGKGSERISKLILGKLTLVNVKLIYMAWDGVY